MIAWEFAASHLLRERERKSKVKQGNECEVVDPKLVLVTSPLSGDAVAATRRQSEG